MLMILAIPATANVPDMLPITSAACANCLTNPQGAHGPVQEGYMRFLCDDPAGKVGKDNWRSYYSADHNFIRMTRVAG
jgi:hypothetical protein